MGEHNENCLVNTTLKSIDSICRSYVRFWNRTQRKVDVIWMNYEGNRVKYKTLHPHKFVDVNTFVTHPWIFWDSNTHDQMVVHGQKVFQPKPWDQDIPPNLPRQPFRRNIFITLPDTLLFSVCNMSAKKRTYNEAFLKMSFTSIIHISVVKPQCVVCGKVLSHESMKPNKLKVHFESLHSQLVDKNLDYFKRKEASLKASRLDSTGHFARQNKVALEDSYRIALKIAQTKKSHTIGEDLVKPCILEATKAILEEQQTH
ncbi:von Hippel-Lindau protein [Tachypleus tridentatus]|uniref:von Hippel-Lindau protein n=1 Tax=Tachypleus tridentatus TaxID=6853 RepID=UPI003FD1F5A7